MKKSVRGKISPVQLAVLQRILEEKNSDSTKKVIWHAEF